jgi:signal peptidase I
VQTVEPAGAVAEERPWWETADAEGEDEVVDESAPVASAEPVQTVEPAGAVAEERPWWETAADDGGAASEQAPVASVEPVQAVEPAGAVAEERPWWETADADEDEAVDEPASVASVEPAQAVEPAGAVAEDRPWWETAGADEDEPVEEPAVVASAEPVQAVEPEAAVAEEKPWWERTEAPETTAQFEQAQPPTRPERDDPWASFAARRQERLEPPVTAASEAPEAEDMWGDIAETAEQAIADPDDNDIDLAASLEEQMGAALDEPVWGRPVSPGWAEERARGFASTEEEGDVILRAFEEHAAAAEPEPDPEEVAAREAETAAALAALLGENASQIVKEAGEEPQERPFIRMGAWAPQRGAPVDDGWVPEEELSAERRRRTAPVGFEPGQLDLTPPWVSEFEESDEPAERSRSDGRLKAWVRELVETVMLAALVFLSVRASFGNFMVDGNSMYPTLENGQFLIVNKLVYSEVDVEKLSSFLPIIDPGDDPTRYVFHGPQRGDIIVLRDPRDPSTDLIKRVIGLPGETIQIENGKVYINDRLLEEPYVTTPWNDTLPKILIPADEYFVMGDNRTNSLDSRSAQVGLIAKDLIVGKATLVYLPLSEFGLAPNQKGTLTDQRPVLTTKRIGEE